MTEYRFAPAHLTLPAGTSASVEVRNDGRLDHDWALLSTLIDGEGALRDELVIVDALVRSGGVERLAFTVPTAGVYQIVCTIPGHVSQGMIGTLTASAP